MIEKNSKKVIIDPSDETSVSGSSIPVEWLQISFSKEKRVSDTRRILSNLPLFENLSMRQWRELSDLFHKRTFTKDEIIFKNGTPGLGMYAIIDGSVAVYENEDGVDVEIARLGSGDFFGEMSLVEEVERSATIVALETTRLIGIFRPQLKDLMHRRPQLGLIIIERLARILTSRLREADHRLAMYKRKLSNGNK
ncbi:cyclic nucleotide-binding domain-containing protein [bacterium]|nr:cyclic nucleotide-binding domain-containing protein [bacterium]